MNTQVLIDGIDLALSLHSHLETIAWGDHRAADLNT
jgi:hypothetical protein